MNDARRKELEDWRATLPKEAAEELDRIIQDKGEEYVLSSLGYLKGQLGTFEASEPATTRHAMTDDILGCDSDYDEVLDEVWKDIHKKGLSGNSPTPEEWDLWAAESAACEKARDKQRKDAKVDGTEGSQPD